MNVRTLLSIIVTFSVFFVNAQRKIYNADNIVPQVGKRMPEFTLDNVSHFEKRQVSLKDFKGKWLFLDFWFKGCVSCIKSFPKINSLQQTFNGQAVFLLVGINKKDKVFFGDGIEQLYARLEERQKLRIPAAFDSVLREKWDIRGMPHIIIIDPDGIVQGITNGQDMTSEKIRDLIQGKSVAFYPTDIERPIFNPEIKPGESQLLYRALLTKWNGEDQLIPDIDVFTKEYKSSMKHSSYYASMIPIYQLYNLAYTGSSQWMMRDSLYKVFYPRPILEMKDSSLFHFDYHKMEGIFNFELAVPDFRLDQESLQTIMQNELKNIFGYEASVERRSMPVWMLVAEPGVGQKLKTTIKGDSCYSTNIFGSASTDGDGGAAGFICRNYYVKDVLSHIVRYHSDINSLPFFDATGITEKIDITIDALVTDFQDLRQALQKNGLDLVMGKKEMNVIVIRDAKVGKHKTRATITERF